MRARYLESGVHLEPSSCRRNKTPACSLGLFKRSLRVRTQGVDLQLAVAFRDVVRLGLFVGRLVRIGGEAWSTDADLGHIDTVEPPGTPRRAIKGARIVFDLPPLRQVAT